jgi:hypothetical protein
VTAVQPLEPEGEHEPWCNTETHPPGRCLRRVDPGSATATLLDADPPELDGEVWQDRDDPPPDPGPVTTLTVDMGGARMIRVRGDRGDVLCLTNCGTYPDVAALQAHAQQLAEVLGCPVALFGEGVEPVALPAQANLGVATTIELLDELRARLDVSGLIGETPRGDYRTSTGQPVGEPAPVAHPLTTFAAALQMDPQLGEVDPGELVPPLPPGMTPGPVVPPTHQEAS